MEKLELQKLFPKVLLYIAWVQAFIATAGSLYFSEVLHYPPCILCWYQRIVMYPLVILIAIGILRKDKNISIYVLPLSVIGIIIAAYHNLLYFNILPESAAPCVAGVSCTTKFIEWFGFITIPFLSLLSFVLITGCLWWHRRLTRGK